MNPSSNEQAFPSKAAQSERKFMRVAASQTLISNHRFEFDFEMMNEVLQDSELHLGSYYKKQIRLNVVERYEKILSDANRREKWSTSTWVMNTRMEVVTRLMAMHRQKQLLTKAITLKTLRETRTQNEPISHFAILFTKILDNAVLRRKTLFMSHSINVMKRTDGFIQLFKSVLTVMRQRKSKARKEAFKVLIKNSHLCRTIQRRFPSHKILSLNSCFKPFISMLAANKKERILRTRRLLELLLLLNSVDRQENDIKQSVFTVFKQLKCQKQAVHKTPVCSARQRIFDQIQTSYRAETVTSEDDRYYKSLFENDLPVQKSTIHLLKTMNVLSVLGELIDHWINIRIKSAFEALKSAKKNVKNSSFRFNQNNPVKQSQTSQFARVLLVVLGAVLTKQKHQAWMFIRQTCAKRSHIKQKIVYPRLTHLIKPVSPQRNHPANNSAVNKSLNFDKSFANYSSIVRPNSKIRRIGSKVSIHKTEADPYCPPRMIHNSSQNEILVDRYIKHQAMRSISRTRTLANQTSRSRLPDETTSIIAPWKCGIVSPDVASKIQTPAYNKTLSGWCLYNEVQVECSPKKSRRAIEKLETNVLKPKIAVAQSQNQLQLKRGMYNAEPQLKNQSASIQQFKYPSGRQANPMTGSYQKIEVTEYKLLK